MPDPSPRPEGELSPVASVRKRPGMYVGSTAFFGFINYLVCPIALLLGRRPTRISVAAGDRGFVVESDTSLPIDENAAGRLIPFEEYWNAPGHAFEGLVLNALSENLMVEVREGPRSDSLSFHRGARQSHRTATGTSTEPQTTLEFAPDASIFTVTELSPAIFTSYLRRLSFLHRGVRFSFASGGATHEFHAERGIVDLFASVAAPYQLLHEPIHIIAREGELRLEAVFAYHSWKEDGLWCFINDGRAVEGGTHEAGFRDALNRLQKRFRPPGAPKVRRNGVVGILSIYYPDVVWEGCIKAKIQNPELRGMVSSSVVQGTLEWLQGRPDILGQLGQLETFKFPDVWYL